MKIERSSIKPIALLILLGVGASWALKNLSLFGSIMGQFFGFVFPFFMGVVVAFVLNIPMNFFERKLFHKLPEKRCRIVSFITMLISVLGVLLLLMLLVIPQLTQSVISLVKSVPEYIEKVQNDIKPLEKYIPYIETWINKLDVNLDQMLKDIIRQVQSSAGDVIFSVFSIAGSIVNGVVSFIISVIFASYLLLDKKRLNAQVKGVARAYIPQKWFRRVCDMVLLVKETFHNFVTGQCLECVAIGLVFAIALPILRFEYWLLIAVMIGVLSLIPIVGSMIACVAGAFLILMEQGPLRCLAFVIIFLIIQQLDANFMYPHIVSNSVGLPSIWVLVAVTLGGSLLGIVGMLFFIPLFSVLYTIFRHQTLIRLRKKDKLELAQSKRVQQTKATAPDENN